MEEKTISKCCTCIYKDTQEDVYPCNRCKSNMYEDQPGFNNAVDYYVDGSHASIPSDDPVNHPAHYTQGSIECIDAMESAFGSAETALYCTINAFKYIWRCENKNGAEDLLKASWYISKAIELIKKGDANDLH